MDIIFSSAKKQIELIHNKKISSYELTKTYLDRIKNLDSNLNSFLYINEENALEIAKEKDDQIAKGIINGKLFGLPIAIKDLTPIKGMPTTSGSLLEKDNIAEFDNLEFERIKTHGPVILGKTNTPEFGLMGHTENLLKDHCRTPWNHGKSAGGSSGGAGSAVAANNDAGMAMLATHISAAAGSLAWMAIEWMKHGKPSVLGIVTGMVAGLGTITPASGFVGPLGALCIGISAGIVCYYSTQYIKRSLRIDDSLDVFPVHGVGGILGTILAAVFVSEKLGGSGYAEGVDMLTQLSIQLVGVAATIVWCGVMTLIVLKITRSLTGLRVSEDTETAGLDLSEHDERGYNM